MHVLYVCVHTCKLGLFSCYIRSLLTMDTLVRTSEKPVLGGLFCAWIVLFLGLCGHLFLGLL